MKFGYKRRRLRYHLIAGLVWLVFFMVVYFTSEEFRYLDYFWLIMSLSYLGIYFFESQQKYLSLAEGKLKIHGLLGKKVRLQDIKEIRTFAGDYIIKTGEKKIVINTLILDPTALEQLTSELEKLPVKWT